MNSTEYDKLVNKLKDLCILNEIDYKFIDFEKLVDNTLTFSENYNIIKNMYNLKEENELYLKLKSDQDRTDKVYTSITDIDGLQLLDKHLPLFIAVVGNRGSGKTALCHNIVDKIRLKYKMPIYVFKYPKEQNIHILGYKNIKNMDSLEELHNIVLWLDEPQLTMPVLDKKANAMLLKIISICRQRNIILVISTVESRWITRGLESYVDLWIIKDIDYSLIKNGSKAKEIIRQNTVFSPENFKLDKDEYLMHFRKDERFQGKFKCNLPKYWNTDLSMPYNNQLITPIITALPSENIADGDSE